MYIHTRIGNPMLGHYETKSIGRRSSINDPEAVFEDAANGCGDYNNLGMLESQLMCNDFASELKRRFPLEGLQNFRGEESQGLTHEAHIESEENCEKQVMPGTCHLGPEKRMRLISDDVEANRGCGNEKVDQTDDSKLKDILAWLFVITNFILEFLTGVFDQLSSKKHPHYALIVMLISFITFMCCIADFIYRTKKEIVNLEWRHRSVPRFYCPHTDKPSGTPWEIIGFACAIPQFILAAINYFFIFRHIDSPIKISPMPIIFAFGLLCSKYMETTNKSKGRIPTAPNGDRTGSLDQVITVHI